MFRTFCRDKEKLVMQIRTSDTNRAAAVGRHAITFDDPLNILKYSSCSVVS